MCEHIDAVLKLLKDSGVAIIGGECCGYGQASIACHQCEELLRLREGNRMDLRHYEYAESIQNELTPKREL